jgi:hypothetical protein
LDYSDATRSTGKSPAASARPLSGEFQGGSFWVKKPLGLGRLREAVTMQPIVQNKKWILLKENRIKRKIFNNSPQIARSKNAQAWPRDFFKIEEWSNFKVT